MQPFRFAPHLLAQNSSAASSTAQPLQDTAADTATTWPDEVTTLQQLAETYGHRVQDSGAPAWGHHLHHQGCEPIGQPDRYRGGPDVQGFFLQLGPAE